MIIFLLLALIQGFLQLSPGVFAIFYHQISGKKSRKAADDLSLFYILGIEFFTALIFLLIYVIIYIIFSHQVQITLNIILWILAGILFLESIGVFVFYYRRGQGTQLFINRRIAKSLTAHAASAKTRLDAFALGFITSSLETIFTLPLFIILATGTMQLVDFPRYPIVISYIIIAVLPIFVVRGLYRFGHNLANIEHFRVRNKTFFRVAISLCYIALAIILIFLGANIYG